MLFQIPRFNYMEIKGTWQPAPRRPPDPSLALVSHHSWVNESSVGTTLPWSHVYLQLSFMISNIICSKFYFLRQIIVICVLNSIFTKQRIILFHFHLRVLLAKELSLGELCNGDRDDLDNPGGCVLLLSSLFQLSLLSFRRSRQSWRLLLTFKLTDQVVIIQQEGIAEEEWSYCQWVLLGHSQTSKADAGVGQKVISPEKILSAHTWRIFEHVCTCGMSVSTEGGTGAWHMFCCTCTSQRDWCLLSTVYTRKKRYFVIFLAFFERTRGWRFCCRTPTGPASSSAPRRPPPRCSPAGSPPTGGCSGKLKF